MSIRWSKVGASALLCVSLAMLASLARVNFARAEAFGEIGKVGSFGGAAGEFDFPTALAVNAEDNSAFVLDEPGATSTGAGPASFRVQKFTAALAPNASATIPTPEVGGLKQWIVDIAVDPAHKRLYVLKAVETARSGDLQYVASQLVAYSTEPSSEKLPLDPNMAKGAGVFYNFPAVPASGSAPAGTVAEPTGLAVNPTTHAVLVLGRDEEHHTLLEQINVTGQSPSEEGTTGETFDDTNELISEHENAANSVALGTGGAVYLTVHAASLKGAASSRVPAVLELPPGPKLSEAEPILVHENTGELRDVTGGNGASRTSDFGPQIAVSPDGSLVYATEVNSLEKETASTEPKQPGNYEIRGMSTEAAQLGAQEVVFGGAGASAAKCLIASSGNAIAAGSGGVVYVLDEGNVELGAAGHTAFGFHLIKFGPGGSGCPVPSASFDIGGDASSEKVTVHKGEPVIFTAVKSALNGEEPIELQWDLDGSGQYATKVKGTPVEKLTASEEYFKPGVYTIGLKISLLNNGTYGNPPPVTRKIEVVGLPPEAHFEVSNLNPKSGEPVTLDGSGSLDPLGLCAKGKGCGPTPKLKKYEWSFGDGSSETIEEPNEPKFERSFSNTSSQPRSESVTLVVTNKEGVRSAVSEQKLIIQGIEEKKEPVKEPTKEPVKEGLKEPVKEVPIIKPQPRPLTNAQKLANALKVCKKIKSKRKRSSCEAQAKHKYGPKSKKKKKKK